MTTEERIERYDRIIEPFKSQMITTDDLIKLGYFTAPASTKYHGSYEGGLFDHCIAVMNYLVHYTARLGLHWINHDVSPIIVSLYHDLCKCDAYRKNEDGTFTYNNDILMPDHGARSIIIAQRFIKLTEEEIACIRWHMGAFETDTKLWNYYGRAIEKYPNVLYTHTADMAASRIMKI